MLLKKGQKWKGEHPFCGRVCVCVFCVYFVVCLFFRSVPSERDMCVGNYLEHIGFNIFALPLLFVDDSTTTTTSLAL